MSENNKVSLTLAGRTYNGRILEKKKSEIGGEGWLFEGKTDKGEEIIYWGKPKDFTVITVAMVYCRSCQKTFPPTYMGNSRKTCPLCKRSLTDIYAKNPEN